MLGPGYLHVLGASMAGASPLSVSGHIHECASTQTVTRITPAAASHQAVAAKRRVAAKMKRWSDEHPVRG